MPPKDSGLTRTEAVGARRRCLASKLLGIGGFGPAIVLGYGGGVCCGGCCGVGVYCM